MIASSKSFPDANLSTNTCKEPFLLSVHSPSIELAVIVDPFYALARPPRRSRAVSETTLA